MSTQLIDANIILRYLTNDPPEMVQRAEDLIDDVASGRRAVVVEDVIPAEVVWTLKSFYRADRVSIADRLLQLVSNDNVLNPDKASLSLALTLFGQHNLDFADALLAARSLTRDDTEIISFDRGIDRISGVVRLEP
jgi:predicted nucleic acid-binding protein